MTLEVDAKRKSVWEQDYDRRGPEHGVDGHIGWRCGICALMNPNAVVISPNSGDFWQNKQIHWQEACDIVFRAYDDAVADHFPVHMPQNCGFCPTKPHLPPKPVPPVERSLKQGAK